MTQVDIINETPVTVTVTDADDNATQQDYDPGTYRLDLPDGGSLSISPTVDGRVSVIHAGLPTDPSISVTTPQHGKMLLRPATSSQLGWSVSVIVQAGQEVLVDFGQSASASANTNTDANTNTNSQPA